MPGRPRKPTALKLLQGNPGKRKLPKGEPKPALGASVPSWLGKAARVQWEAIYPRLVKVRVMTDLDGEALGVLCGLLAQIARAEKLREKPDLRMITEARQYLGAFGMTPSSRSKVTAADESKAADPFEVFLGGAAK